MTMAAGNTHVPHLHTLWCAAGARRMLLQTTTEGASVSSIVPYLAYVDGRCGDPAKAKAGCLTLLNEFCGNKPTSEVLCSSGSDAEATFRSASRCVAQACTPCHAMPEPRHPYMLYNTAWFNRDDIIHSTACSHHPIEFIAASWLPACKERLKHPRGSVVHCAQGLRSA